MRPGRIPVLFSAVLALVSACSSAVDPTPATSSAPGAEARTSAEPSPEPTRVDLRALTPAELQGRWWSWAASIESGRNPVVDPDGRFCGEQQKDGIWLLAGTFGRTVTRACTLPVNTQIAFPVLNLYGPAADCLPFMNDAKGSAVLDGRNLPIEELGATPITMNTVRGNPVSDKPGYFFTYSCGLWVRLDPLAPGRHEIVFRGSSGDFSVGVDYSLTVTDQTPSPSLSQSV
ncbi:signal protein [Kitasatospora sp. NPDC048239]|uniref:signal protein n=1 Tax=Kitasatospora sp. NPDC048239 TaxID=3364046 RepID=UPI003716DAFF